MEKNIPYDVSGMGIRIRSYNHQTGSVEMRQVLSLVRKGDSAVYELVTKAGDIILKCSGGHRIWDEEAKEYHHIHEIESGTALNSSGEKVEFLVRKTNSVEPIVDLEVEGNANYFTNGILSHNTTPGGKALKFYASVRLKFTKLKALEEGSGDNKQKVGVRTRVEAVKNKTFPPYRRGEFIITFGKGIDDEAAVFQAIIETGLVGTKAGGWYTLDGQNIARGLPALHDYYAANPAVYERLKAALRAKTVTPPADAPVSAPAGEDGPDPAEDPAAGDLAETGEV
ncbi:MAG: hypothetical protein II943_00765 [Victivallales bacterium]|nr:hypothetical protein [Victivallales bacterium]